MHAKPQNFRLLQISDTHLFADAQEKLKYVPTFASFKAVWQAALAEKPQLVLFTGDVSQDDSPESYAHLASFLQASPVPVMVTPGNHDQTAHFDALFQVATVVPIPCFKLRNWRIVLLNSLQMGQIAGRLSREVLNFLKSCLQNSASLLLALHHPPFSVGSRWMDRYQLENKDELWEILENIPQLRLLLAGHVHQDFSSEIRGVKVFTVPSTCTQFLPQSKEAWLDQKLPGFRIVDLADDGRFVTQVKRVHPFVSEVFLEEDFKKVAETLGLTWQPARCAPRGCRALRVHKQADYEIFAQAFQATANPHPAEIAAFWQWLAQAPATPLRILAEAGTHAALLALLAGVMAKEAL